ncbi:MAG: hypothetical protein KIS90_13385 [Phenylobacterium sp.]|nr:hypothetical protein [Phenylobacterium sp.]
MSPAATFIARARAAYMGEESELPSGRFIRLFDDFAARTELVRLMRAENDPNFREFVGDVLDAIADELEEVARGAQSRVELIDRSGFPVAVAVTGAAILSIVVTGGAAGPISALIGGAFSLGVLGIGRTQTTIAASDETARAARLRALAGRLRGIR